MVLIIPLPLRTRYEDQTLVCDPEYPEMPCFNALTNGDVVLDTAAAPKFTIDYDDIFNCSYVGNGVDCQRTPYFILDADVRNYMAYTVVEDGCMDNFTVGQAIRMQESIDWDPSGIFAAVEKRQLPLCTNPIRGVLHSRARSRPPYLPRFQRGSIMCSSPVTVPIRTITIASMVPAIWGEQFSVQFYHPGCPHQRGNRLQLHHAPNHSSIYIGQLAEYTGKGAVTIIGTAPPLKGVWYSSTMGCSAPMLPLPPRFHGHQQPPFYPRPGPGCTTCRRFKWRQPGSSHPKGEQWIGFLHSAVCLWRPERPIWAAANYLYGGQWAQRRVFADLDGDSYMLTWCRPTSWTSPLPGTRTWGRQLWAAAGGDHHRPAVGRICGGPGRDEDRHPVPLPSR